MMLSSASESTRAVTGWEPEGNRSSPERVGLVDEAESVMELTSMPLVTGELWLLPGIDRRSAQAGRSTDRGSASVFSPSAPEKDGCGPALLDSPFCGERLGSPISVLWKERTDIGGAQVKVVGLIRRYQGGRQVNEKTRGGP